MPSLGALLSIKGRDGRTAFCIIYIAYEVVISVVFFALGLEHFDVLIGVGAIGVVFVALSAIRRLHDRDRSALWLLIFFGPAVILMAPGPILLGLGVNLLIGSAEFLLFAPAVIFAALAAAWGAVELAFLKGTPGPNRFGPDPLAANMVAGPVLD